MSWDIVYTMQARKDLRDIYEYIALELLVPETASEQTRRIMYQGRDVHKQLCETLTLPEDD